MFVISTKARRQLHIYNADPDEVEQAVRRPDHKSKSGRSRVLAERTFEGEYYWLGRFYKKRRIEVLYEETDRDTTVLRVRAEYL